MISTLIWRFCLVALWMTGLGASVGVVHGKSVRLGFGSPTPQGWRVIVGEGLVRACLREGRSGESRGGVVSSADAVRDEWTDSEGPEVRRFQLRTEVIQQVNLPRTPIVTQDDFMQVLSATYSVPQMTIGFEGVGKTSTDTVRRGSIVPAGAPRLHVIQKGTHRVRISYQWPAEPRGAVAGYTAPLAKWVETRLEGWKGKNAAL